MTLFRLLWISRKISGGLEFELSIHWPWEQLLIGYAGVEADDVGVKGSAVYRGALYLLILTLDVTKVYLPEEYWKDEQKGKL